MSHDARVVKEATLEIQVIRADGTVEDLGVVASSKKSWARGLGAWLSKRRIEKVNRRLADAQQGASEKTD